MDFDDLLKLAFKISGAVDAVKDQEAGESEEILVVKQKLYGRRKKIHIVVEDVDS